MLTIVLLVQILSVCSKRLIADYGFWSRSNDPPYNASVIPYDKVTHINHAGIQFDNKGNVTIPRDFLEPELLVNAHAKGVKVNILPFGDFPGLRQNTGALDNWLDQITSIITKFHYDGIDVDWEYPQTPAETTFFIALLRGLRSRLPSPRYIISVDTNAAGSDSYAFPEIINIVDFINVMTYDFAGPWTDSGQLNSAVFTNSKNPQPWNCDPCCSVDDCITRFLDLWKIPKDQVNMGTPFYGYVYDDVTSLWGYCNDENCTDTCDDHTFNEITSMTGWKKFVDSVSGVPFMLKTDGSPGFITYDDPDSTFLRVSEALKRGIGGNFIWELSGDYDGVSQKLLEAAHAATQTYL